MCANPVSTRAVRQETGPSWSIYLSVCSSVYQTAHYTVFMCAYPVSTRTVRQAENEGVLQPASCGRRPVRADQSICLSVCWSVCLSVYHTAYLTVFMCACLISTRAVRQAWDEGVWQPAGCGRRPVRADRRKSLHLLPRESCHREERKNRRVGKLFLRAIIIWRGGSFQVYIKQKKTPITFTLFLYSVILLLNMLTLGMVLSVCLSVCHRITFPHHWADFN